MCSTRQLSIFLGVVLIASSACRDNRTRDSRSEGAEEYDIPAKSMSFEYCGSLSFEDCEEDPHCNVKPAARYDEDRDCMEPFEPVECRPRFSACGMSETCVRDPERRLWFFRDTCYPSGWGPEKACGELPPPCDAVTPRDDDAGASADHP